MSTGSNIEWTDATWTPVKGCTRASEGCDHCYAVTMTHRLEKMGQSKYAGLTVLNNRGERHFNGQVVCDAEALSVPLHWKKPRKVFVSSMSDVFHKDVPDTFLRRMFAVMSLCGQHAFQVLTKRPERMATFFADPENSLSACQAEYAACDELPMTPTGKTRIRNTTAINGTRKGVGDGNYWPLPNVWLGTSVENQAAADERIPELLKCPAAVRFLSCEPLLGPVDLSAFFGGPYVGLPGDVVHQNWNAGIDWVIVGGESGPKARPCDVAWIRSVVQQCKAAGVPCFVKQLGARVHCRNDHVSDWLDEVGMGLDFIETDHVGMQGDPVRVMLTDKKGGDMAEWPEDLRVREMPEVRA